MEWLATQIAANEDLFLKYGVIPVYKFQCHHCGHVMTVQVNLYDYERMPTVCTACHAERAGR